MRDRPGPWDPGLPGERTGLAWQRTLLSGLACALVVARLLATISWPAALVTGLLAVATTTALGALALHRVHGNDEAVRRRRPLADGRAPLLLSVLVTVTALAAGLFVLIDS